MATWQEIGQDNFRTAQDLYEMKHYRSSVSRFYYAAFSLLTYELARSGVVFRMGRRTPAHAELAELVMENLTQFSEARRTAITLVTLRLYRSRLDADYSDQRIDRKAAERAMRDAGKLFRYFGVEP